MKRLIGIALLACMMSCKSKSVAVAKNIKTDNTITANTVIENHYNNKSDFSTLYIKSDVRYADEKQTQNVTAEIKIKKNEKILVSIRFLGITMAKALITPNNVSYYEKINSTYFEGDFSSLSKWLGTDLDFYKIQNMLIGEAMEDLKKGKYNQSIFENNYKLDEIANANTKKSFFLDTEKFIITKQEITQTTENRMIEVLYSNSKNYNQLILPSNLEINAEQQKGKTKINLEYNAITVNEELSFPYSVPSGYEKISIK